MYTDEQVTRGLEHHLAEARRMRSEYIASLICNAYAAAKRAFRRALRRLQRPRIAKGVFARR